MAAEFSSRTDGRGGGRGEAVGPKRVFILRIRPHGDLAEAPARKGTKSRTS